MTNFLEVKKPFFVMEVGDTFEYSEKEGVYVSKYSESHTENNDSNANISSTYSSEYKISKEYAKALIESGFLAEVTETAKTSSNFVNVFDEINSLLDTYKNDLKHLDEEMAVLPACLKVEKQTVLTNLIDVLTHLSSLKK